LSGHAGGAAAGSDQDAHAAHGVDCDVASFWARVLDGTGTLTRKPGREAAKEARVSTLSVIARTVRSEGLVRLYNGLSAGLFRQVLIAPTCGQRSLKTPPSFQVTYTTTRMGVFQFLLDTRAREGKQVTFAHRVVYGALAGGVAGVVGNPGISTS
jgi:hypothetical protein